jgi:hypothetical protein
VGTSEGNYTVLGLILSERHGPRGNGVPQRVQTAAAEGVLVDNRAEEGTTELQACQDPEVWQGAPQMAELPVKAVERMAAVLFRVLQIHEHFAAKSMRTQLNHGAFH